MTIRAALIEDSAHWARMRSALWPAGTDDHPQEIGEYFAGTSPDIVAAYVMEADDGTLAGFLELNIRNFAEGSRSPRLPYVEAWFVDAAYRGQGHGRALMAQAEAWALARGYRELASDTEIDNTRSIALHKSLGFRETDRIVCFLKRLG